MKTILIFALVAFSSLASYADSLHPDTYKVSTAKCQAAKSVLKNMTDLYLGTDRAVNLRCTEHSDCKENFVPVVSICAPMMMNSVAQEKYKLLTENMEYQKILYSYRVEARNMACGPIRYCAQRPLGTVKCIANKCAYKIFQINHSDI